MVVFVSVKNIVVGLAGSGFFMFGSGKKRPIGLADGLGLVSCATEEKRPVGLADFRARFF
jgi:hypothetical protein